jgi:propanediol utilization protein
MERNQIELLVREALKNVLRPGCAPCAGSASRVEPAEPKLVVNVSARHAHVTQEDLERLYGAGHKLTPFKWLYQDGFFAAEETVTFVGPRQRVINNLRILGPCRDHSQVELAFTDAVQMGLDIPVRKSGDHRDSPGAYLIGPKGMVKLDRGVIRHQRHVHMCQKEADFYGVKDGDFMKLRVVSDCPAVMEEVLVRVSQGAKLEVHIDTDEGNAVNLAKAKRVELFR